MRRQQLPSGASRVSGSYAIAGSLAQTGTPRLRSWLLLAFCLGVVGTLFLGLALFGVAGLAGLFTGLSTARSAAAPESVRLIVPNLGAISPPAVAPTPASAELKVRVETPLPTVPSNDHPQAPAHAGPDAGFEVQTGVTPTAIPPPTYRTLFQEVGAAHGIDWRILAALAFRESSLDPLAVGRDGDMGLMQILPSTWDEFAPKAAATEPFDPYSNAEVAATYLLYLQRYLNQLGHGEIYWVLVAYNWGPDNVRRLLSAGGEWTHVPERQRRYTAEILEAAFGVRFVE